MAQSEHEVPAVWPVDQLSNLVQRYLLVWLVLFSAVALFWGRIAGESSGDPFVGSKPFLEYLISLTMFCIGCLISVEEVNAVVRRWPTVLGGTAIQYTTMPLLAWGCGHLFGLDPAYLIGVIVVGCVPGAMASNVLTLAARGNVSYSVSLTTSATILSPLIVPFAFWLTLGAVVEIDPLDEAIKLLKMVVVPVVAGHLLCRVNQAAGRIVQPFSSLVANGTIIWVIAVVVALNRTRLLAVSSGEAGRGAAVLIVALVVINLLGYLAGYVGGSVMRLPTAMRRALTLEVGMQNAGLGTVLVLGLFKDQPEAAIPTALYTFGCMLSGTLLAQIWGRRPTDEAAARPDSEM
jgi:BASS family bile acid:Na+ symporter